MKQTVVVALTAVVLGGCRSTPPSADETVRAALAAQQAGDLQTAEQLYEEALRLAPRDAVAWYDLGTVELARNDLAAAERSFRAALDGHPEFIRALFDLAIVRTRVGATQEAVDLYRRVIAVDPNGAAAHHNLGTLLQAAGLTKQGTRHLAIAQALSSGIVSTPQE